MNDEKETTLMAAWFGVRVSLALCSQCLWSAGSSARAARLPVEYLLY
jgi:hypothetical protein